MTPEEAILELIANAKPGRSVHPTDAARLMYKGAKPDGWMDKMPAIRHAAIHLARQGKISLYRKGKVADPNTIKGVYRLGVYGEIVAEQEAVNEPDVDVGGHE